MFMSCEFLSSCVFEFLCFWVLGFILDEVLLLIVFFLQLKFMVFIAQEIELVEIRVKCKLVLEASI